MSISVCIILLIFYCRRNFTLCGIPVYIILSIYYLLFSILNNELVCVNSLNSMTSSHVRVRVPYMTSGDDMGRVTTTKALNQSNFNNAQNLRIFRKLLLAVRNSQFFPIIFGKSKICYSQFAILINSPFQYYAIPYQ